MLNFKHTTIALVFAGLSAASHAAPPSGTAADYGVLVPAGAAMRTIAIDAGTTSVNVANGETVRFTLDGQDFTWHFDTYRDATSFDLAAIVPAGVKAGAVRVYVASNPLYRG
jgi:hypothetical protein